MHADAVNLLDSIYDSIDNDESYALLPSLLARYMGGESAWALVLGNKPTTIDASCNIPIDNLAIYEAYYGRIDPFAEPMTRRPMDTAISFERLIPSREYERTEFYNDYVRANHLCKHVVGAATRVGDKLIATTFQRNGDTPFDAADERRLQEIVPHLHRVYRTRDQIAKSRVAMPFAEALFQEANDAVLLCDAGQRVVHFNRAVRRIPIECLSINRNRCLMFRTPASQTAFIGATDHAIRRGVASMFEVPREGKLPYRVVVERAVSDPASIVVKILDLERQLQERIDRAQQNYLFTPSECALAESLMRGRTLEQHSLLRGTALSTVRSQLHLMLEKSKSGRQVDLVLALCS